MKSTKLQEAKYIELLEALNKHDLLSLISELEVTAPRGAITNEISTRIVELIEKRQIPTNMQRQELYNYLRTQVHTRLYEAMYNVLNDLINY